MNRRSLIAASLAALLPTTAAAKHGGEPHPKGYGRNACTTLGHDLAVSRRVYDDRDVHFRMNLIGCHDRWDTGDFCPDPDANICERVAHREATKLAPGGLLRDLPKVGRAVAAYFERRGQPDRCTVEEDWSWSDAFNPPRH